MATKKTTKPKMPKGEGADKSLEDHADSKPFDDWDAPKKPKTTKKKR